MWKNQMMNERENIIAGLLASAEKDLKSKKQITWIKDMFGKKRNKLRMHAKAKLYLADFLIQERDKNGSF